jgi:hypothetical protein
VPKVWYDCLMRNLQCGQFIDVHDMLDFLESLQEQADELVVFNDNCEQSLEKYDLMNEICDNAWQQAQVRAWINTATHTNRQIIVDINSAII